MKNGILVINAGSSSIKFSVYIVADGQDPQLKFKGQVEGINLAPHFIVKDANNRVLAEKHWDGSAILEHADLFAHLMDWVQENLGDAKLTAAGHRIVHGGQKHSKPCVLTPAILDELESFVPLAPLHQPHNLAPVRALAKIHPDLVQVACFDTAFHRTNDPIAEAFALPRSITAEGVKRYGFHGLSYEYIAARLAQIDPELARGRVVVCHLGSGASACALKNGQSVTSTMGFTALDGLIMGTRAGSLDAGVVLYLMQQKGLNASEIETILYKKSGLLGVSGISNDMRDLLASDDPQARLAVDMFCYRINRELGSLAAALGGLDGLVFTAGIGEHSPEIRAQICGLAHWLGVELDEAANQARNTVISTANSRVKVLVIPSDEEMMIAKHACQLLTSMNSQRAGLVTV